MRDASHIHGVTIEEHLFDSLATKLLAGKFKAGEKIKVEANGDRLTFKTK